jgi:hypothetical protein
MSAKESRAIAAAPEYVSPMHVDHGNESVELVLSKLSLLTKAVPKTLQVQGSGLTTGKSDENVAPVT